MKQVQVVSEDKWVGVTLKLSDKFFIGHFLGLGLIYVKMPKYFRNENILRAKLRKSEDI